ncbi:hypothetical protein BVRB_032260, partial [Beta vulgaris subsp. vulgaris]
MAGPPAASVFTDVAARLQELASHNAAVQRSIQVEPVADMAQSSRTRLEKGMNLAKKIASLLKDASVNATPEGRRVHDKLKKTLERELKRTHALAEQLASLERSSLQEKRRVDQVYQDARERQIETFPETAREPLLQDQVQIDVASEQARQIEETEAEIRQIERDVVELNDMFKDMGILVEQQQEGINHIEDNIVSAEAYSRRGYEEVQTAARYQRHARSRMCKLLVVMV